MRKNQLTIAEKARQLKHDYKINLTPFLAKECGYTPDEIKSFFPDAPEFKVPPPMPSIAALTPPHDDDQK